jgi:hypothetical protein
MEGQTIDERQAEQESVRLLRAFTAEYRRAKIYRGLRHLVGFLLAIAGPIAALRSLTAAAVVGAMAGLWLFVGRLVLQPAEDRRRVQAALVQERFDTRVFDMPWSDSLVGPRPSEEDIAVAARRLTNDRRMSEVVEGGWYPSTATLPRPADVLVAQISSVAYGRRHHTNYHRVLSGILVLVVVSAVTLGGLLGMSLIAWLITFLLPSLPALLDAAEVTLAHRRQADNKKSLEDQMLALWDSELEAPGSIAMDDCRGLQDEAYKLRVASAQVPELFHYLRRRGEESTMREGAAARVSQYMAALATERCATPPKTKGPV